MIKKGTTFIELLVVLGLISIIVFISFGYMNVSKKILVRAELEKLYSLFIFLQRNSMLEHRDLELTFSLDENSYSFEEKVINLGRFIKFGTSVDIKGPPSNPVNVITTPCSFLKNKVVFYADGRISSGIIYLTDSDGSLNCAITVSVSDFPYIRRYIYRNKSWALIT